MTATPRPVRAAIVGLGAMGAGGSSADDGAVSALQSHAAALATMPDVELIAVADVSDPARARFLSAWSERWPEARTFDDHRALLEECPPDLLTVATPDHLHGRILLDAISTGVPYVFAEKPLVT
jgi:predicted dehydrogenase